MRYISDILMAVSIGLIGYGVNMIHSPTAFITVGMILGIAGIALAIGNARTKR